MSYHNAQWHVRLRSSATPGQVALAEVDANRLVRIEPEIIATLWDPWRCPAKLLPFLAWALSVDIWDETWSEIDKRREIAASPLLHRIKGTRGAIERSLGRMGLSYIVTEWWEPHPIRRRGTIGVFVDSGERDLVTVRSEAAARTASSKPKSRLAELTVGELAAGSLGVVAAAITRTLVIAEPFVASRDMTAIGPLRATAAVFTRSFIIAEAR
jgi:phage tail P2-like protein